MASVRKLKKDIDYLTFAVVGDSLNCLSYGSNSDEISEIVQTVIDGRTVLRMRINAGKNVSKSERKAYYRTICKDLMLSVDEAFSKLSDLVKKD